MELAGRYQLERRLAAGGMGEVWEATAKGDAGFTRRVAIKRLFPDQENDAGFVRMFLDEARIASRLHHANIVSIIDFGVAEGVPFQVLEFVDGFDASRLWAWGQERGAPLPPALALFICGEVAHALHHAHQAVDDKGEPLHIVHRDVSPQNILVARTGDVKLSDFGIALAAGRSEKTVGSVAKGKPAYMAPEQAIRGAVDARTDVFSLGCVLHSLTTGQSPMAAENALVDLLAGVELTLSADLPLEARAIVEKATKRTKAQRYETAEAFSLACTAARKDAIDDPRTALRDWVIRVAPAPLPAGAEAPRDKATWSARTRPRSRRWFWVAGAVVGVALTVAWRAQQAVETGIVPPPVVVVVPPLDAGARNEVAVVTPPPAPEPVVDAGAGELTAKRPTEKHQINIRGRDPTKEAKRPATPTGVLAVGGEAFLRAAVVIDGTTYGYAPMRVELPVGEHEVQLVLKSGKVVGPRRVGITPRNTEVEPATWVADSLE